MIRLGLDGVVADYFSAALRYHGATTLLPIWERGNHDMAGQIGISRTEFDAMHDDPWFWESIKPYPGAVEFVDSLRRIGKVEVHIVCSVACESTRRQWCDENLGLRTVWIHSRPDTKLQGEFGALVDNDYYLRRHPGYVFVPRPWDTTSSNPKFDQVDYAPILSAVRRLCNDRN